MNIADLSRGTDMSSSAWLAVNRAILADQHQPNPAGADRWAHVLRLHKRWVGAQLLFADPMRRDPMVGRDQSLQFCRHIFLGDAGIRDIEKVMQDGYSTGKSLGMGLPGSR